MPALDASAYHRAYYHKRRQRLIDYLGGKCAVCGTTERLEVDHIDRSQKSFNVQFNLTFDDRLRAELDKCQLLCTEHHRQKTARENSGFTHGSVYGWMKKRCRCAACDESRRKFHEARNERRREDSGARARGPYGRPATHGEVLMYRRGCRCDRCRAANADHMRYLRNRAD